MKFFLPCLVTVFFSTGTLAQTITWSPDLVKPKETEVNSLLTFPGTDENNYYVDESVFGTVLIRRKWKDFIKTVDKTTLKVTKEYDLSGEVAEDGKKYFNVTNFVNQNRSYNFFIDINDKDVYTVYATVKKVDDAKTPAVKPIQKVDIKNEKPFQSSYSVIKHKDTKEDVALKAASHVEIKAAFDGKTIISAFVYESIDEDYSMLNISEWDTDLKATISNNYKIPFKAYAITEKTIFGKAETGRGTNAYLGNFIKDNNGFVYVVVNSANPKDKAEEMRATLYQFRLSDPSYVKTYRKEWGQEKGLRTLQMFQDQSGKVFIASRGREGEIDNYYGYTNSAFIGSFNEQGQLQTIFFKHLSTDMMYLFEKEKTVDKRDGVETLYIRNVLPSAEGGCFIIWEREWEKTKENNVSNGRSTTTYVHTYYNNDNLVIQYFNSANKMLWQKPVYKEQKKQATLADIYTNVASGMINNNLYLFYPDDPKNADKAVDEKQVSEYNISRFSSKDLAGMFVAKFDTKGTYTRKYINWPEDRIGFALCTNSFSYIGNNECIAAVRKIKQGALSVRSEEYTFFKLKF